MEENNREIQINEQSTKEVKKAFDKMEETNLKMVEEINKTSEMVDKLKTIIRTTSQEISTISSISEENGASLRDLFLNFTEVNKMIEEIDNKFKELKKKSN